MRFLFRGWRRKMACAIGLVIALVCGCVAYHKWHYPYGWSHCCITQMSSALNEYARLHGKYPSGEASPEASLSLLYGPSVNANLLRGMTISEENVQLILENGGKLSPSSCGWHYVPGLTRADNPALALLWCKEALNHNGGRSSDGGREVIYLRGNKDWISGTNWHKFLAQQNELMNRRTAREIEGLPLVTAAIELPDGTRIDRIDGEYKLRENSEGPSGFSSATSSGLGLTLSELIWYRAPVEYGSVVRTLSFGDLESEPIIVEFKESVPDVDNVTFNMKDKK